MDTFTRADVESHTEEIIQRIKDGALFIHPTDTIYGLGCDATNSAAVRKLRELKERQINPFSVWVPSIAWIRKHCEVTPKTEKWLQELPGPYTLILRLKDKKKAVVKEVVAGKETLGVRYPNHWFGKMVELLDRPIVTTSVNKAGEPFLTTLSALDSEMARGIDFAIDEGEKNGRPSTMVDVEKEEVKER
ncbi:threonylcarbamoyl-AMP synthase [Candidatus Woesearchaeota archaeon]|nr:threonylcarbamoyl-AMP synthase [Candidatus Woesearchaeota archaeon]